MPIDIGGLDPLTVSLRDYLDRLDVEHAAAHQRERDVLNSTVEAHDKHAQGIIEAHFLAHDAEHEAVRVSFGNNDKTFAEYERWHQHDHGREQVAIQTALKAVQELATLHGVAHDREHHSHEVVHQREREAAALARADLDDRLRELDSQRVQTREQNSHFMLRTEAIALIDKVTLAIEAQTKSADNAHNRMDLSSSERQAGLQKQIDDLKLAQAAGMGGKQTATYIVGLGVTLITIIVAIVGVYLSTKGAK